MRRLIVLITITLCLLAVGCSHSLRLTNLDEYYTPPTSPLKDRLKLGVSSKNTSDAQLSKYISAIVEGLKKTDNFERVIYPFDSSSHQVDFVTDITVSTDYSGSGMNFLINWPGFLIFAPAIWGYSYNADIQTNVDIADIKDHHSEKINIPTKYYFRQAEMDRTWTEIGWLEWGVIPLIGGIVFTGYDNDVTNDFIEKVSPSYGSYVANKIMGKIKNKAANRSSQEIKSQ